MDTPKPASDPLFPHGAPPPHLVKAGVYPEPDPYWAPAEGWREQDGLILLPPLVSDGTSGEAWIAGLGDKGFNLSHRAIHILISAEFRPAAGEYRIAILPGNIFPQGPTTAEIRANAARRGLSVPPAEAACLIRERLSDADLEAMGLLSITVMHDPIRGYYGVPYLLAASRSDARRWLCAHRGNPREKWVREVGFAFVLESER